MTKWRIFFLIFLSCSFTGYSRSISEQPSYLDICHKAAVNKWFFQNFRSMRDYAIIIEYYHGKGVAELLLKCGAKNTLAALDQFKRLDGFGNPQIVNYNGVGEFSGTTLRYIAYADQIQKLFNLPKKATIVEIGAGFGGQCYILSCLQDFAKYYIYDLPEVEELIEKVSSTLDIKNVQCLKLDKELPEKEIDLLISNYAYSECDKKTQMEYFDRVIKKAKRGYMVYNQISGRYGVNSLTAADFMDLLEKHQMNPKKEEELIISDADNVLITWDKTRKS